MMFPIVVCLLQVDAAGSDGDSGGQASAAVNFKDRTVRQFAVWLANLTNHAQTLWNEYAQQILVQSDIAARLSDYAEAIMNAAEVNKTCVDGQKEEYTQIKLLAIDDYHMCSETQALTVLANYTTASQNAWERLRQLDKKITTIKAKCNMQLTTWFLNMFIRMMRDLCKMGTQPTISRELSTVRETNLMELYKKAGSIMLENGMKLEHCISIMSSISIEQINENVKEIEKCIL